MTLKTKYSLLVAAAISAMVGAKANAAFSYDLQFTATGNPTAPSADLQTVVNPAAGVYHLQLFAVISGDTTLTNDSFSAGYFYINDTTSSSLLFKGAGAGLQNVAIPSTWEASQVGALQDSNSDGVGDWGAQDTSTTTGWNLWQTLSAKSDGGTVGQQVNSTTWEVLVATMDVNVTGLQGSGDITFNPIVAPVAGNYAYSGAGKHHPVIATIDGTAIAAANAATLVNTSGLGATFIDLTVPEPASLGVLALGGLALLARRRK